MLERKSVIITVTILVSVIIMALMPVAKASAMEQIATYVNPAPLLMQRESEKQRNETDDNMNPDPNNAPSESGSPVTGEDESNESNKVIQQAPVTNNNNNIGSVVIIMIAIVAVAVLVGGICVVIGASSRR